MSNCIFCKIISKEIPSTIFYEDDVCIAFDDINPQAPVHVLIVPKEHIATFNDLGEDKKDLIGSLGMVVTRIAEIKHIKDPGYRIVINCNTAGGQLVYHLHVHLLGGRHLSWPPG